MRHLLFISAFVLLLHHAQGHFNYTECTILVTGGQFGMDGTVDRKGHPLLTTNTSAIEGYMYSACVQNCGGDSDLNSFDVFASQFTLWFLPWFQLLSQIPYDSSADLLVMFLSIGSPTTALFSLFITLFDRVWLDRKCKRIRNSVHIEENDRRLEDIAEVSFSLHQFPIEIEDRGLLACTLAMKENKEWWKKLRVWFVSRRRQMDASAWAQLALSILVYLTTVLPQALGDLGGNPSHFLSNF